MRKFNNGKYLGNNKKDDHLEENNTTIPKENKKTISRFSNIVVLLLIVSLVGGFSIGAGFRAADVYFFNEATPSKNIKAQPQNMNYNEFSIEKNNISSVVDSVKESVVAITSKKQYRDWFNNQRTGKASGSGVIISKDESYYYIVTNNHVVQDASELIVGVNDQTIEASIVGTDPYSDLAVVKIKKNKVNKTIEPIVLGNSDNLNQGDTAIALGNPLGYNHSVTVGVISALNRTLDINAEVPLIQTDAAINPGNSGGALINGNSELIGINTAKIASEKVEGMGFAIPINHAKPIIKQLIEDGSVKRPYLGIAGKTVNEELSELYELPLGVVVTKIGENTPAHEAGLQPGDVIIKVNDTRVNSIEKLSDVINNHKVGDTIELTIIRKGKEKLVKKIELENRNQ